jgi:EpsI family protein
MGSVEPPGWDLEQLPVKFEAWTGQDVPADARLLEQLQARAEVDRQYRNPDGDQVHVHAVWTDDYVRVHFPQQCYRESGWQQTASKDVSIPVTSTAVLPGRLLTFQRDAGRVQVLYWFQLGDQFFLDRWGHRSARRHACWGTKQWPPLVKVMLETQVTGADEGETRLREIARHVFLWMNGQDVGVERDQANLIEVTVHRPGTGSFFGPFWAEKCACPLPTQGDSPRERLLIDEQGSVPAKSVDATSVVSTPRPHGAAVPAPRDAS